MDGSMLSAVLTDLRHAIRSLRRNPGPVLVSVLSLALGIGATATMLSVVDAIDFRPLPYGNAERLVELAQVESDQAGCADCRARVSPGLFGDWQDLTRSYGALAAASSAIVAVDSNERLLEGARVSGDFFATLDVAPIVGRAFTADEVATGERVLVISDDLWQSRFTGDVGVVGKTVSLSWAGEYRSVAAAPYTIVGVLPRGVRYPGGSEIWLPASGGFGDSRQDQTLTVIGRLRQGTSISAARAELDIVSRHLASTHPDAYAKTKGDVSALRDAIRIAADERGTSARFLLLFVAAFVLLLATINVANVFLVRAAAQGHDLVIRAALGAPRTRLVRLLLGQSISIALSAGALGVLLSLWGIRFAEARLSVSASGLTPVLDWRVLLAALTLALAAGLIVGLLPAIRLGRPHLQESLRARTASGGGNGGGRVQGALVVAQVACALVLLSGAGLLTRDFVSLMTRDPGFEPERLLVASLPLNPALDPLASNGDAREAVEHVASVPGILGAALGALPAEGYAYRLEDERTLTGAEKPLSYRVSAAYFRTLGVPLLAGRAFLSTDRDGSMPVAIVSRVAAQKWWPGENAVGKRLFMGKTGGPGEWVTIVGVMKDERVMRNMRSAIGPVLYRPFDQLTGERRRIQVFARTAGRPHALVPQVREAVKAMRDGEGWQGDHVMAMTDVLGSTLSQQRFRTWSLALFSAFGLLLAAMGIYGVVATVVNQRTAEIGIRVALGARPVDVLALVARRGVALAMAGMALGLGGAFAATRLLQSLVVSGASFDLVTLLVAGAFLTTVVLAACYVPGRRAARIDPLTALRK